MKKSGVRRIAALIGVAAIAAAAIGIMLAAARQTGELLPVSGVLDLSAWDAGGNGELTLSGEWDFYWNRLVPDLDNGAIAAPDLTVRVPSVWNSYKLGGAGLPGFGYGTYHLSVKNAPAGRPLAIRLQAAATSFELFVDGQLVSSCGTVGADRGGSSPGVAPQVALFTPERKDFDLSIRVANFAYAQGGMPYAPCLGTEAGILHMDQSIADQDLMLLGALAVMAFYFVCVSLLRRSDRSGLFFVLVCALLAGLTATTGSVYLYRLMPGIGYDAIMSILFMVLCWLSVCVAFGAGALFPESSSKTVLRATLVYALIMTAFMLATPVSVYSRLMGAVQGAQVLIDLYLILALALAFVKGRKDALILLVAMLASILCWTHEHLYQSGAARMALYIILLTLSFVVARRFAESFQSLKASVDKTVAAETAFMQAQIRPHFLYNTLNTISSFPTQIQ